MTVAKRKTAVDQFVNRALVQVTTSAADALTFTQMRFGMGIFTGTALVINRIEWTFLNLDEMAAVTDILHMAITNRDDLAALGPDNMNVLAYKRLQGLAIGTPASWHMADMPYVTDFSQLPGGGLIVPANPLFMAVGTDGFAAAATVQAIMYYLTKELVDADFIELVQSLIPVNI